MDTPLRSASLSDAPAPPPFDATAAARLAQLDARLARIEAHLGFSSEATRPEPEAAAPGTPPVAAAPAAAAQQAADALELEVGQTWFASVGILVLALGAGFMLTLPYPTLPSFVPPLTGLAVAAALFLVARAWQRTFELVASYLRGAAMALLFCATLRVFFFGTPPALSISSPFAPPLLALAVVVNGIIAARRDSPWLMGLALITGYSSALAVGSAWWVVTCLTLLVAVIAFCGWRRNWPALVVVGIVLTFVTYALWAIGNPVRGGAFHYVSSPWYAPAGLLLYALVFGGLPLLRPAGDGETIPAMVNALVTCVLGYTVYLIHTAAGFPKLFVGLQLAASAGFIALAVVFWRRHHCRVSVFLHAMTGYAALSMAIIKLAPSPEVFVWLALQSVGVVTTAIWFRSRSIVVANFLIYLAIVLAYVAVKKEETGISLVFGVVALVSARILNWQKHRLELKTEMMRNAYLLSAAIVFPYALFHLVPARVVGLAWIGMATAYYVLNFVVRNRKYRWMGHGTLLLTAVYLLVAGGRHLEPAWRVATFLALGGTLMIVSLIFTRLRRRELDSTRS